MLPVPGRTQRNLNVAAAATREAQDGGSPEGKADDKKKVLVADDHPVVRMGAVSLLQCESSIEVIAEAATCGECCDLAGKLAPDVIILDLEMGDCRATQSLDRLLEVCPSAAVVVYTAHVSDHLVRSVIGAGARGFVPKDAPPARLVDAVMAVAAGQCYLDPSVTSAVVGQASNGQRHGDALTEREQSVLRLLAQGKRNKEISKSLFISERTVKFHVSALMHKLGATNRTEAVKTAIEQGLVGP
jgi:two-component system NarL family response regulator